MNNLNLIYKLCSYKGNEKLLINYRLVKESQEIDGKIVKTLQLKLHRRKNKLKNRYAIYQMKLFQSIQLQRPLCIN